MTMKKCQMVVHCPDLNAFAEFIDWMRVHGDDRCDCFVEETVKNTILYPDAVSRHMISTKNNSELVHVFENVKRNVVEFNGSVTVDCFVGGRKPSTYICEDCTQTGKCEHEREFKFLTDRHRSYANKFDTSIRCMEYNHGPKDGIFYVDRVIGDMKQLMKTFLKR